MFKVPDFGKTWLLLWLLCHANNVLRIYRYNTSLYTSCWILYLINLFESVGGWGFKERSQTILERISSMPKRTFSYKKFFDWNANFDSKCFRFSSTNTLDQNFNVSDEKRSSYMLTLQEWIKKYITMPNWVIYCRWIVF